MAGVVGMKGGGGRRPGAGRKPRSEKYATAINRAEKRIADRLPDLVDRLFELAEGVRVQEISLDGKPTVYQRPPDFKAASYLVDRIIGKPTQSVEAELSGAEGKPPIVQIIYADSPPVHDLDAAAPASGAEAGD